MFNYFIQKRHGSISVMLAILLIAVLSFNTSLLEIARYRSSERLYRELTENAAFSLLGYYDRDLYEDYGLLALEKSVGKEEFLEYMEKNLNGLTGMPQNVSLEKLYDLTQEDVLRTQIMEFTAYRAPISMVNNALNLEDVMGQLMKELENALPLFELFLDMLNVVDKTINAVVKLGEYSDASKVLNEAIDKYEKNVGYYNATIGGREQFISDYNSQQENAAEEGAGENPDIMTPEEYESGLEWHNQKVEEHVAMLREDIVEMSEALAKQQEAYGEFLAAYEAVGEANMTALLNEAEIEIDGLSDEKAKKGGKAIIKAMEEGLNESENIFRQAINAMDRDREAKTSEIMNELTDQLTRELGDMPVEEYKPTQEISITTASWLETAIRMGLSQSDLVVRVVENWLEIFDILGDYLEIIEIIETQGGTYDIDYHSTISDGIWNSLPGKQNGDKLKSVNNPYAQTDVSIVQEQLNKTVGAAAASGFDLGTFDQTNRVSEMNMLRSAINRVQRAEYELRQECAEWGRVANSILYWELPGKLLDIVSTIEILIEFVDSIINLILVFIEIGGNMQMLLQCMYQGIYAASYANDMFSNRTTKEGDERMNGSSFGSASGSFTDEAFAMANTEYILSGTNSEVTNQQNVFWTLLTIRMLCNLPAVLTNEKAMDIIKNCPGGIVTVIVAIVVVCVLCLMEGWMDMLVMLYGEGEVEVIKLQGYFTFDKEGNEKLINELKAIVTSLKDDDKNGETKKTISEYTKDYGKGLLNWTYKDHLFLMMLLSIPTEIIYARCADLIEMQMKQKKKLAGDLGGFELEDMMTYIRVESEANYTPMLPIPSMPGINNQGIKIKSLYYSGY